MPRNFIPSDLNPSEVYPDPLSRTKGSAIACRLTDVALAGDVPASRLFANLAAAAERDIRREVQHEREAMNGGSPWEP